MTAYEWGKLAVAVLAVLCAAALAIWFVRHRRSAGISDTARDIAKIRQGEVRERAASTLDAEQAAGRARIAEADAEAERKAQDAIENGSLADYIRDLNNGAG